MRSLLAFLLLVFCGTSVDAANNRPNVIFVLIDDLGWTDFGCFGSDLYQTPELDRLAADSMKFTAAYSACTVCSPTRAAFLTGRYPARLHVTDWIPGQMPANPKMLVPDWTKHLAHEEVTIAERLREAGYATASIGKWHLGDEAYFPETHGFDINIGGTHRPEPPSFNSPYRSEKVPEGIPTIPDGPSGEHLTDRLAEEAVKFISASRDRPFFLYLPHFAVHLPIQGRPDLVEKYQAIKRAGLRHRNAGYAAMVESVDMSIGRIRQALADLGIADRTILVVTSDNGGRVPTTSNVPLRAGKGSAYEGGVRVPLIVHWPGVTKPGSVSDAPVMTIDFFPTIVEMTATRPDAKTRPDGVSLVPLLKQTGHLERDALFWHYPHHQHYQQEGAMPYSAMREGKWRLIEFFDDGAFELYDLDADVGERHNLAGAYPDLAARMRERLAAWRTEVGAQLPTPNPGYNPGLPQHIPKPKVAN
ncbi:Arylsulfatase [Caulifigura coniformis]|uniref:Arylsulfatase n=1 Tax=Caulifigura coniformis TaxID=2527983 RepID=A0A517SLZ6_9PLAN|nr:sulfatase [Caulifigura coniformis]QDT57149.1 Arylsulfatase [Caulifigura coniformis]